MRSDSAIRPRSEYAVWGYRRSFGSTPGPRCPPLCRAALRLAGFHRHWRVLAERADAEGWPAWGFLSAPVELCGAETELAERDARRIPRHLQQSQLPGGKTPATLDFTVLHGVPCTRIEALAAGDWIETGTNLIAIGKSGAGKSHTLRAIGHAALLPVWWICPVPSADFGACPGGGCGSSGRSQEAYFRSKSQMSSKPMSLLKRSKSYRRLCSVVVPCSRMSA